MRLASFVSKHSPDIPRYGAVIEDGIVDLAAHVGGRYPTLRALIAADALDAAREVVGGRRPDHALSDVIFRAPIPDPEKVWCIGVNYRDRNEEYKDGSALPKYPSLFARSPRSLVGHGENIERPRVSNQLDYEGELVLVIGKAGRHLSPERACEHVFGMTLGNEGTVRDWLRHGKFNVTQGKNFDRSGSVGPWIVTADELDPRGPHQLTTRVNGEVRQDDSTERLIFPFGSLLAYLTTFATLAPGDLLFTGTPTGAGARFDPPRWLTPGDVLEVESPGIGTLRNFVVQEP